MKINSLRSGWLMVACLFHATLITTIWLFVFKFDVDIFSGKIWMWVAAMWYLWIPLIMFSPHETLKRWVAVGIVGIVMQIPTISTLYTFLAWTFEGFAT